MIRSCSIAIFITVTYLFHFGYLVVFLPYGDNMWCLSLWRIIDNWKSCKMGRVGSSPEFHVNFGLGRVGSLHLWVELGRVKKIGPTSNFAADPSAEIFWFQNSNTKYIVRIIINTASRSTMVSEVPLLSTKQNIVSPPVLSAVVIEARRPEPVVYCHRLLRWRRQSGTEAGQLFFAVFMMKGCRVPTFTYW